MTNGKGSMRRPLQVSRSQYDANWEAVFGKRDEIDEALEDLANEKEEHKRFIDEVKLHESDQDKQLPLPLKERK